MKLNSRAVFLCSLLLVLSVFSLPSQANNCQFDQAVKAFEATDYKKSLKLYKECAKQGHVESNAAVGKIYLEGLGTKKNARKAVKYLEVAAHENHLWAQKGLAHIYRNEKTGLSADTEAAKWVKKLADSGESHYQAILGDLYQEGKGVEQDYLQAKYWYEVSINNGYFAANRLLGFLYLNGLGVDKNPDLGLKYTLISADKGDPISQGKVGMIYLGKIENDPEAVHQAIKYFSLGANQGYGPALHQLWGIYYFGNGVQKDYKKAFELAMSAARQRLPWAYSVLGGMYYSGKGFDRDPITAYAWFKISYEQGDKESKSIMKEIGLHRVHIIEADKIAEEIKHEIFAGS